jgi:hypothetical protein
MNALEQAEVVAMRASRDRSEVVMQAALLAGHLGCLVFNAGGALHHAKRLALALAGAAIGQGPLMSEEGILWDAEIAADISELFTDARERAVATSGEVLLLVNTADGLECWSNVEPTVATFLAQSYITKAVLDSFPGPLESTE